MCFLCCCSLKAVIVCAVGDAHDVTHNTAKKEEHVVNGERKKLLVHRKGATRAYPPGHPSLPDRSVPLLYCQRCSAAENAQM